MSELSPRQKQIFEYIKSTMNGGNVAPSVREIAKAVGLNSTASVQYHLKTLEDAGLIQRGGLNQKRSISLPSYDTNVISVPLLGTVTAGIPILTSQYIDDYIPITGISADKEYFALKVKGDSMINAHIVTGDTIIVERTPTATNGEIVVAMIDDEATVKRFYKEKKHYRLQPENDQYEPIITDTVDILGKVVKIIRDVK